MYQNAIYYIKNAERNIETEKRVYNVTWGFGHSSKGVWEQKAFSAAYLVTNKGPLLIMGITQGSRIKDLLRYGRNTRPNLILGSFHLGAKRRNPNYTTGVDFLDHDIL